MKLVKYEHEYDYEFNLEIDSMFFDCHLMALELNMRFVCTM